MALERIVLNIIPEGEMPVFHCSQYENGRPVIIDLVSSDDDAFLVPEGATVELHCRKVDDNIVTLEPDEVDNNTVTFISTEQLTACPGDNLCEVVLYANTDPVQTIATLNFILHVEPDPMEGGLTSETQIYNLTQQIEEITQQVIGDDYYNKTEVDDLLDDKADQATTYTKSEVDSALALKADKSDTYTKTQVDNALALKADASDVYTKSQVDTALASKADTTYVDAQLLLKANAADVYTKAQTYSQAEVDALIDNIFPTLTASGDNASFTTALSKPLVSVTTAAGATTVTRCGTNFLSFTEGISNSANGTTQTVNATGGIVVNGTATGSNFLTYGNVILPSGTYYLSAYLDGVKLTPSEILNKIRIYTVNTTTSTVYDANNVITVSEKATFTTLSQIRSGYSYTDNIITIMLEKGSSETSYEAYNGQTVPKADATTLVTQSGVNNVFADVGDVTVQYKYMSM